MDKYIEVAREKETDRYHFSNISEDDFFDVVAQMDGTIKDITKEEYESHINYEHAGVFNVDDRFYSHWYSCTLIY
jgi:hypothetical protein